MSDVLKNFDLYSFDVFDTLITRKVVSPKGIFVLIQHILNKDESYRDIPEHIKTNFIHIRTDSEYHLRKMNERWHNRIDIKLDDIYSYMGGGWRQNKQKKLKLLR